MDDSKREAIGLFRFGIIFPLLDENMIHGAKHKKVLELASAEYAIPFSSKTTISVPTIYLWLSRYVNTRNIESLFPKDRGDKGSSRKISKDSELALKNYRSKHPEWKLTTLVKKASEEGLFLPHEEISMAAVYRIFDDYDAEVKALATKDMRRFMMENCNDLWILDSMVGDYVYEKIDGRIQRRRAYLWAFIDDRSRLITHAEFYLNQKAESLIDCLNKAIHKRGLPIKIFTDNGSAMKDATVKLGCADLEISLSYAKVRAATSKAKVERLFSTVRMQFMPEVEGIELSLYELNKRFEKWVDEYNNRYHSAIASSPLNCFMNNIEAIRPAPPITSKYFRRREERKVSPARTIQLHNKLFQVPLGYAGRTIEIRYFDLTSVEGFYDGASLGLLKEVDLIANSNAHRQNNGENR